MLPDASAVDDAVIAALMADSLLLGVMTDGVYRDVAKPNATKFVIVSRMAHGNEHVQPGQRAFEVFTFLVKAVAEGTSGADVKSAAKRIDVVMQDDPFSLAPELVIPGYQVMRKVRLESKAYTEVEESSDRRWQHRGGLYEVVVDPNA